MKKRKLKILALMCIPLLAVFCIVAIVAKKRFVGDEPINTLWENSDITKPAPLASWPWKNVKKDASQRGVTRFETASNDGTTAILFSFDFKTNPNLRWEIIDQDEDDKVPGDNKINYWMRGVGGATRDLNARGRGKVIAAWNGLFFGYANKKSDENAEAFHVSPVVLNSKVLYYTANHRWGFGVKNTPRGPVWKTAHLPSRKWFASLDWGGGSAQCLVLDGKPLKLQPFPAMGAAAMPQPVKSTPAEVGHIPIFDHMKTARASLAWSKDFRHLYVLIIKEDDSEGASALALKYHRALQGGWTVPDLQKFWLALQAKNGTLTAMNSDAGDVGQVAFLRADGKYDLLPSRQSGAPYARKTFNPDFKGAPAGGAAMYFYVLDTS